MMTVIETRMGLIATLREWFSDWRKRHAKR